MSKKKQKSIEELLEEALVPEEEQPYKVPENWVWTRLGKLIELVYGKSLPEKKRSGNGFPVYGSNGVVGYHSEFLIEGPVIIVGRKGSYGEVNWYNESGWAIDTTYYVLAKQKINYKYVYYLLKTLNLKKLNRSTAIPGLNREDAYTQKVVLPPFKEQKRIVEKIEQLFAKIDEAKRLIEEVKGSFELRWESILDKAFRGELTKKWRSKSSIIKSADDIFKEIQNVYKKKNKRDEYEINPPFPIPQNWRWVRLGDIVDINPARKKLEDIEDIQSCSFIPMPSVNDKTGEIENPEIRKYAEVKKGYTFFLENDILFAKITPCMENGKTAIAHNLINGFGFGSTEFHVIRTNPYINTKLIYYLLRSKKFRMEAKKEMTGAVGQQRVPKSFLENYLFPLPPKAEQDKIVELLDHLHVKEVEISKIEALEGEIDSLRQSILNKAFRGELGTNDLTDKHAIELLKEVLKSK
ncbi:restriction endonuclease subunit S [Aeribacillus sp. FSL K6-8210]|jgi:type I restriction enzyme S subunit|uniref:restriction endonuclease subunit S n=1 Tax=Aeribacillus sp. FSL K6-8210 TaxID=2954683 RepID=UPI0030CDEC30